MIKNAYDSSLYRIEYRPYTFFSFLFGGVMRVSCKNYQGLSPNLELCEIFPELTYKSNGAAYGHCDWYECRVKNDKEAESLLVELKMRGYKII